MSKILIIGNSPACISVIEQIRTDASAEITLLCPEGVLPYDRGLLSAWIGKDIKDSGIYVKPQAFFKEHNVHVVLDQALERISTKRKNITTKNKTHIPFDKVVLMDLGVVRLPAIKGHHKEGIFNAMQLTSVKSLGQFLPFADNVVVPVTNFAGFDMACALKRLGKDVVILSSSAGLLGEEFDEETSTLLRQITETQGIRVMVDGLEEILGDSQVKAVRLKSGKVIAAEAVVFDQLSPDLRILADTGVLTDDRIAMGEFLNTPLADVFACDAILGTYNVSLEESQQQGRCAGANMLNLGAMPYQASQAVKVFGHKICDGFCGGIVRLQHGGREHMQFDGPKNIYKKIFLLDDRLVGAVWFNAFEDKAKVEQALTDKMPLAGNEDKFLQSTLQCVLATIILCWAFTPAWAYDLITRASRINANHAQEALQSGDTAQAIAGYQHALELKPDNTDALMGLATAEEQIGALSKAKKYWQKVIDINPDLFSAYSHLGDINAQQQDFGMAVHYFQLCLEKAPPDGPDAAKARQGLDNIAGKSSYYRSKLVDVKAQELDHEVNAAASSKNIAILTDEINGYKSLIAQAKDMFQQGHYQDAINYADEALKFTSDNSEALAIKNASTMALNKETTNALTDASINRVLTSSNP